MRLTNVFGGRPSYFDRNPLTVSALNSVQVAIAPHGTTQRWTYTVPTARKAVVMAAHTMASRITAATTAGGCNGLVSRATTSQIFLCESNFFNNTAGAQDRSDVGNDLVMLAGEQILGQDFDGSTAGTVTFEVQAALMEFDA